MTDFERIFITLIILGAIIGLMLMIAYKPVLLLIIPISVATGALAGWAVATMKKP